MTLEELRGMVTMVMERDLFVLSLLCYNLLCHTNIVAISSPYDFIIYFSTDLLVSSVFRSHHLKQLPVPEKEDDKNYLYFKVRRGSKSELFLAFSTCDALNGSDSAFSDGTSQGFFIQV